MAHLEREKEERELFGDRSPSIKMTRLAQVCSSQSSSTSAVSQSVSGGRQPVPMIGALRLQSADKDIVGDMSI